MTSKQEFERAKQQVIKAIIRNRATITEEGNYLKIEQNSKTIRLPAIYSQSVNSVNSFK